MSHIDIQGPQVCYRALFCFMPLQQHPPALSQNQYALLVIA
jgi:hypothetical protein